MKRITAYTIYTIVTVLFLIALVPAPVFAELAASPWPMFRGDLLHTGRSAFAGSTVNTLKWKFKTNDKINSSPVIGADGTIYIGSEDNGLYAVSPDGIKIWKYKTGSKIISTPAIGSDGTIYVGADDDKLHAINPDGTLKWKAKAKNRVQSSPAIGPDGTIYVGSNDGYLYAFNPDGTKKWKYDAGGDGGDVFSSPALASDGTIYVGSSQGKLHAINPDGTKKWKFDTDGQINSSPALGADGTIYAGASDGYLYAVIPADGTKLWRYDIGGSIFSSPAIGSDGTIYVGCNNDKFLAVNPDGTKKWSFGTNNGFDSSPVIDVNGIIYVGCNDDKIYALNPDGTELWKYDTGGNVFSSPAIGSDGTIYVGSTKNLYAIGTSQTQAKTLSLSNLSGSPGETLTAAIQINNASGIKSGAIAITFDSDVLNAQDPQTTSLSSQVDLMSEIVGGQVSMTFNASSTLSGGSGTLFMVPFTIKDNAPEGTYSLTFNEASLLGDDGTGITVTTTDGSIIVVIEQNIVVSIPDVSGHPGETVHAQIMTNNATGVLSGDFTISYDASKVTAGDATVTSLTTDFSIVSSVNLGQVKISIASSSPITSGSGALVSIPLTIGAETEGSSPLSIDNAILYNQDYQEVTITTQDGTLSILPVCVKGDVDNDGVITSADAELVLQISVGLIEPDEYQICAGDVNGDGEINSLDAALINQCAAGDCLFATGN